MFSVSSKKWVLIILIVIAMSMALISLLFFKVEAVPVLAQGGDDNGTNTIDSEVLSDPNLSPVVTDSESDINSQSDGSGIEVVPISAFRHDGNNANGWFHNFLEGYIRNTSSEMACFMAPTYPPDGATLTEFRFSLLDDSATEDLFAHLRRVRLATGSADVVAGGALINLDDPTAIEIFDDTMEPGTAIVNNEYAYYVTLCFAADTATDILFYGDRVFYDPAP